MGDVLSAGEAERLRHELLQALADLDEARALAEYHEQLRVIAEQERLDVLRAARANRSRWKNARRDFIAVRAERDAYRQRVIDLEAAAYLLLNDIDSNITGRVADYLTDRADRLRRLLGEPIGAAVEEPADA